MYLSVSTEAHLCRSPPLIVVCIDLYPTQRSCAVILKLAKIDVRNVAGNVAFWQSNLAVYNEVELEAQYNYYNTLYAGVLNKEVVQKTCLEKTSSKVTSFNQVTCIGSNIGHQVAPLA